MANTSTHYGALAKIKVDLDALIAGGTLLQNTPAMSTLIRQVPLAIDLKASPATGEKQLPVILICPFGREKKRPGNNVMNEVGYPCLIEIVADNKDRDPTLNTDKWLKWREDIFDLYENDDLSATDPATDFHSTEVEFGPIVDPDVWVSKGWYCSQLVVTCWLDKARGN